MILLVDHFRSDDRNRHSNWLRQQRWFIKARQEHHRKEDIADKLDDEILSIAIEATVAAEIQIREFESRMDAFETRLDKYDARLDAHNTAITKALMENRELLDLLSERLLQVETDLQNMLDRAYVMEDGTRVFKSEDGVTVIDEFGKTVDREILDPNLVPNNGDTSERYLERLTFKQETLEIESNALVNRQKLHDAADNIVELKERSAVAHTKISEYRERIKDGGLTVEEIEEFDAELLDAMPPSTLPTLPASAMKHLSGIDTTDNAPAVKMTFTATANPEALNPAIPPSHDAKLQPL